MFRQIVILSTSTVVFLMNIALAQTNDLFSEISSASVFESKTTKSAGTDKLSHSDRRILSGDQLRNLLNSVGFDAKAISGRAASARKQLDPWTFPVLLVISEDESRIKVILGLASIQNVQQELPVEKLLSLMKLSESGPQFGYHSGRERTEVSSLLTNRGITAADLRNEINRLAIIARDSSKVWASKSAEQSRTDNAVQPTTQTISLKGIWTASRAAQDSFAIQFFEDGRFQLAFVSAETKARSEGKYERKGDQLTLNGADGFQLAGQFEGKSPSQFLFKPTRGTALTFNKVK